MDNKMNASEIKEQKAILLQAIQNNLNAWDETSEDAIRVFETNQLKFEELHVLDEELSSEDATKLNMVFKDQLEEILTKQKELVEAVEEEKQHIQNQLGQLGQKNKVVSNYIAMQKKSLFVERNY